MILKIRMWCEGIIVAVIICIIIEALVPEGSNKKYVKVIIGIYIMFVILNPILNLLNYEFSFENIFDFEYEEAYTSIDNNMKDVYVLGIEETIKKDIENMGYEVTQIKVFVDSGYENIEKIEIGLKDKNEDIKNEDIKNEDIKNEDIKIEDVIININEEKKIFEKNITSDSRNLEEYEKIINYLEENYFVSKEQIKFL